MSFSTASLIFYEKKKYHTWMPTANYQQQFSSYLNSGPINKINKRDSKILPQLHTPHLPFFGGSSPREFQT